VITTSVPMEGSFSRITGVADSATVESNSIKVHVNRTGGCPTGGYGAGCACMTPPPIWGALCEGGDWIIDGSFALSVPMTLKGGNLVVNGDFTMNGNSIHIVVTPSSFPSVIVSGDADISGQFVVVLEKSLPLGHHNLVLVSAASVHGLYGLDVSEAYNASMCENTDGSVNTTATDVTVSISVTDSCQESDESKQHRVMVYLVAGGGLTILLIGGIMIWVILYFANKKKESTPRGMQRLHD